VSTRAVEVFGFTGVALDTGDIEGVHDMRVATRRLRAALEVFAPCFPRGDHGTLLKEVKQLADALGRRRDPDVAIEKLEALSRSLAPPERPGVSGLVAELRDEQEAAQSTLAAALDRVEQARLAERLQALAETARA
jgi:CHAD domain-containing protein